MPRHGFRDMQPVQLWSATLHLEIDVGRFRESVSLLSIEMNQGFSGFMTQRGGHVHTFTRTWVVETPHCTTPDPE